MQQSPTIILIVLSCLLLVSLILLIYFILAGKVKRRSYEQRLALLNEELTRESDELKETREQMMGFEKMASLGQLTAGIAHEIRNPLNFVVNFSGLSIKLSHKLKTEFEKLKEGVRGNQSVETEFFESSFESVEKMLYTLEQNLSKVDEHGKRIESIVRGMLLHSRGKAGEFQTVDLNGLISEDSNLVYHSMRAQDPAFSVNLEFELDRRVGRVRMVTQDFSRAFLNIVNNACYAANEKSKNAPGDFTPVVSIKTTGLEDKIEIRVKDNGNGIPSGDLNKIFTPFFTTKPVGVGTGLGLSIASDIIKKVHHGEISVSSKEGEFAEFVIILPR